MQPANIYEHAARYFGGLAEQRQQPGGGNGTYDIEVFPPRPYTSAVPELQTPSLAEFLKRAHA